MAIVERLRRAAIKPQETKAKRRAIGHAYGAERSSRWNA
jgi:hypothetical protein